MTMASFPLGMEGANWPRKSPGATRTGTTCCLIPRRGVRGRVLPLAGHHRSRKNLPAVAAHEMRSTSVRLAEGTEPWREKEDTRLYQGRSKASPYSHKPSPWGRQDVFAPFNDGNRTRRRAITAFRVRTATWRCKQADPGKRLSTKLINYSRLGAGKGGEPVRRRGFPEGVVTMADEKTINGVDVTAVNELIESVKGDPELASCKFRINNSWIRCGENRSKVESFYGARQEIAHETPFTLTADEPPILAGHDKGANPVEHLLHALASCLTTTLVYHAAVRGIEIEELQSELEGDLDLQGFLGLSNEVRRGYQGIRVTFRVKTAEENLERLKALSKLSPVFDVTSNGTNVTVEIERG